METTLNSEPLRRPRVAEAQTVTREFLTAALCDVQRVDITKVAPVSGGEAGWEAEADVWQPNPTLQTLGLRTGRPVLDHSHYLVRLDNLLNVLEYEIASD